MIFYEEKGFYLTAAELDEFCHVIDTYGVEEITMYNGVIILKHEDKEVSDVQGKMAAEYLMVHVPRFRYCYSDFRYHSSFFSSLGLHPMPIFGGSGFVKGLKVVGKTDVRLL